MKDYAKQDKAELLHLKRDTWYERLIYLAALVAAAFAGAHVARVLIDWL